MRYDTVGVDVRVTNDRMILLDTQPVLSSAVLDWFNKTDRMPPPDIKYAENWVEMQVSHKKLRPLVFRWVTILKRQFVPNSERRPFIPSDISSQIPKGDHSSQVTFRPYLQKALIRPKRQFVSFGKGNNSFHLYKATIRPKLCNPLLTAVIYITSKKWTFKNIARLLQLLNIFIPLLTLTKVAYMIHWFRNVHNNQNRYMIIICQLTIIVNYGIAKNSFCLMKHSAVSHFMKTTYVNHWSTKLASHAFLGPFG